MPFTPKANHAAASTDGSIPTNSPGTVIPAAAQGHRVALAALRPPAASKSREVLPAQRAQIHRPPGPMKHGTRVIAFCEAPDGYKVELNESILNTETR